MARAIIAVLDSVGIGAADDAAQFGDQGANTLGHIAAACAAGAADRSGLRSGPLKLPNLSELGLGLAAELSAGEVPAGLETPHMPKGLWGCAGELSRGRDTPSGHWEIAGVPVTFEWGYFPRKVPTFPNWLTDKLIYKAGLPGILGNCHASGTVIIEQLGEEHIRTGKPICYTSADSVFQIAAHEDHFGLERLHEICRLTHRLVEPLNIGRVIARPFIGTNSANFERTTNRRDYAVPPPEPTLLDRLTDAGRRVIAVGKIGDIFAHRGISEVRKGGGNDAVFDATMSAIDDAGDGDLVFANFIDFDSLYGHRRDVAGYAGALEAFDRRLPQLCAKLGPGDILLITADHGCDPTWEGSDHTRENVPILMVGPGIDGRSIGRRKSFADMGASIAVHLGIGAGAHGENYL
jgi:phosphopentomutase